MPSAKACPRAGMSPLPRQGRGAPSAKPPPSEQGNRRTAAIKQRVPDIRKASVPSIDRIIPNSRCDPAKVSPESMSDKNSPK